MTVPTWFEDLPVLGNLPLAESVAKLREVDENLTWMPSTYLSM